MRPDVKLGVAISAVLVLIAGTYYHYRDKQEVPVGMDSRSVKPASDGKASRGKPVDTVRGRIPARGGRRTIAGNSKGNESRKGSPQARGKTGQQKANRQDAKPSSIRPLGASRDLRNLTAATQAHSGDRKISKPNVGSQGRKSVGSGPDLSQPQAAAVVQEPSGGATPSVVGNRSANRRITDPRRRGSGARPGRGAKIAPSEPAVDLERGAAVDLHRIQPGDTFSALSKTYYGTVGFTQFLIAANPEITDPNRLRVGQAIRIPPRPREVVSTLKRHPTAGAAKAATSSKKTRSYTVKPGDTFYGIARDVLGRASRWQELFELNKALVHGDPKRLRVGQVLAIPES